MTALSPIAQQRLDAVRALPMIDVVQRYAVGANARRKGVRWQLLCPFHNEKTPSCHAWADHLHCFGCGAHADQVGFVRRYLDLGYGEAVERLEADFLGGPPRARTAVDQKRVRELERQAALRAAEDARRRERSIDWARALWANRDPPGPLVERYLRSRGIEPARIAGWPLPSLGFYDDLIERDSGQFFPCFLGAIQDARGQVTGIERTWLARDGSAKAPIGKAKKMAGEAWGGCTRLARAAPEIALAEGRETALSVMQATGLPTWAHLSLGNLCGGGVEPRHARYHATRLDQRGKRVRLPSHVPDMARPGIVLPPEVRSVVLFTDGDNKDPETAAMLVARGVARFRLLGLAVRVVPAPAGKDWNDVIRDGAADAAREAA